MEVIIIAYIAEKLTIIMKWNENEMIMKWKWLFFMKFVSSHSRKVERLHALITNARMTKLYMERIRTYGFWKRPFDWNVHLMLNFPKKNWMSEDKCLEVEIFAKRESLISPGFPFFNSFKRKWFVGFLK